MGNEDDFENYELLFQAKDYCFGRQDRTVGVGLLPLRTMVDSGSSATWIQLGRRLQFDETGQILLRILAQRQNDEIAREFFKLNSEVRFEEGAVGSG